MFQLSAGAHPSGQKRRQEVCQKCSRQCIEGQRHGIQCEQQPNVSRQWHAHSTRSADTCDQVLSSAQVFSVLGGVICRPVHAAIASIAAR